MGGWGCPHEVRGECERVPGKACDPGMKGCILFGRFTFSNEAKNRLGNTVRGAEREARTRRDGRKRGGT